MVFIILKHLKEILTIGSLATAMFFGYTSHVNKGKADDANNNLYAKEIQWTDERGRLVTETTELRFSVEDLKNVMAKDSATLSATEKKLWEVGQEAKALKSETKNLISYHKAEVEAVYNNLRTIPTIKDNKLISIEPIETKHLNIDFEIKEGIIFANAKYNTKITTIVDRERDKLTKKGKKRFFIAKWVSPRWQYSDKTVCEDPNASIKNQVSINFDNRK